MSGSVAEIVSGEASRENTTDEGKGVPDQRTVLTLSPRGRECGRREGDALTRRSPVSIDTEDASEPEMIKMEADYGGKAG